MRFELRGFERDSAREVKKFFLKKCHICYKKIENMRFSRVRQSQDTLKFSQEAFSLEIVARQSR